MPRSPTFYPADNGCVQLANGARFEPWQVEIWRDLFNRNGCREALDDLCAAEAGFTGALPGTFTNNLCGDAGPFIPRCHEHRS